MSDPKKVVGQGDEPAHVVVDKDSTARINLGILVSIISVAVLGALFLQDIAFAVESANYTLTEVKQELTRQNDSVIRHSETLIRQTAKLEELEARILKIESQ